MKTTTTISFFLFNLLSDSTISKIAVRRLPRERDGEESTLEEEISLFRRERERFRAESVEGGGRERGTKPVVEIGFGALAPESPSPGPFYAYRMHIEPLRGIACMDN